MPAKEPKLVRLIDLYDERRAMGEPKELTRMALQQGSAKGLFKAVRQLNGWAVRILKKLET